MTPQLLARSAQEASAPRHTGKPWPWCELSWHPLVRARQAETRALLKYPGASAEFLELVAEVEAGEVAPSRPAVMRRM